MTVRVAKAVRDTLRVQEPEDETLSLLLRTRDERRWAVAAVNRALTDAYGLMDQRDAASGDADPPFAGEWFCGPTQKGVLVSTDKCRRMAEMVSAIAESLTRQGVEGTLDLRPSGRPLEPPLRAPMMECRIRVQGRRLRSDSGGYSWDPSDSAVAACIEVAERWRKAVAAPIASSMQLEGVPTTAVPVDSDLLETVLDAVAGGQRVEAASMGAAAFHAYGVHRLGSMSLVSGVFGEESDLDWRGALAGFVDVLHAVADQVAYAYVSRDDKVSGALLGYESCGGRPPRASALAAAAETGMPWYHYCRPRGRWFTPAAFDDVVAPDAFGVQLLGPGYRDRIPSHGQWTREDLEGKAVLLSHNDPAAWFARPEPTDVLEQAREDLADLLYESGRLRAGGWSHPDDTI